MIDRAISPAQFAAKFAIGVHKTLALIASGELAAINVAAKIGGRPQWRITAEALAEFERRRSAQPKPVTAGRRRKKQVAGVIEFY